MSTHHKNTIENALLTSMPRSYITLEMDDDSPDIDLLYFYPNAYLAVEEFLSKLTQEDTITFLLLVLESESR
jgi:hypothetical protein